MVNKMTEAIIDQSQPWDGVTERRAIPHHYNGAERRIFDLLANQMNEGGEFAPLAEPATVTATITKDSLPALESARLSIDQIHDDMLEDVAPIISETPTSKTVAPAETREKQPKFTIRPARASDIKTIVDVDMRSFEAVYSSYDVDDETLRSDLEEKFMGRFEKVGPDWMTVLERDGKIVGSITSCPTSKTPDEFESWEKTTDNGTLETTYDPKGKNVYVVSLSVLAEGSEGKDMLYANQIGKALREGYELSFFESRMPGMRAWTRRQVKSMGMKLEDLSETQLNDFAQTYSQKTVERDGKQVPYDGLLRLYDRIGCRLLKVAPNAYQDEPSMNFGVVCTYDFNNMFDGSTLPIKVPKNKLTRWLFGSAMQLASKSQKATNALFF